ncbi:MAG: hypothetical protein BWY67_02267 [Bacteroidetes bacterium ADurb.Bin397]|jgi:predicted membrane protein|nr:hypothetical protein [Bacteroidia bacterium]OQA04531.1 MAG: hypothetical protein BWY67_02267 [Bacteroidetes bacterium ADurb.Bin397]
MEIIDPKQKQEFEQKYQQREVVPPNPMGRVLAGIIIMLVGGLLLARTMGIYFPDWFFSWQMLLIAIGVFVGAKHNFHPGGWIVPILIGAFFLLDDWIPDFNLKPYFWPVALILVGMAIVLTPGSARRISDRARKKFNSINAAESDSEDFLETSSVFGGVKKNIITKNFKGGEVSCVFGGAEINFSQADIKGRAVLEVNAVFGGAKLIIPANWTVQSAELVAILGGVEDNRVLQMGSGDPDKVLILRGNAIFGGITLKSY